MPNMKTRMANCKKYNTRYLKQNKNVPLAHNLRFNFSTNNLFSKP